jgi:hypothetical protein
VILQLRTSAVIIHRKIPLLRSSAVIIHRKIPLLRSGYLNSDAIQISSLQHLHQLSGHLLE